MALRNVYQMSHIERIKYISRFFKKSLAFIRLRFLEQKIICIVKNLRRD